MCVVAALPLLGAAASGAAGFGTAAVAAGGISAAIAEGALASTVASTIASTIAGAASGMSAMSGIQAAKYNQKVAQNNATALRNQAKNERLAGSIASQTNLIRSKQESSRAAVEMSGRGLDITTGTPATLLAQNEEVGMLDSMTTLNNAYRQSLGHETEAVNLVADARMKRRQARINGFTSLLSSTARPVMMSLGA